MLITKLLSVGWIWMARYPFTWAAGTATLLRQLPGAAVFKSHGDSGVGRCRSGRRELQQREKQASVE
jgi:hypothetical protein